MDQSTEDYVVGLPGRYALSLFELAQEEDKKDFIEEIDQELLTIGSVIKKNNDLIEDNIDVPSKTLFLSDLSSFKNLDNFTPQFYTTFHSRAPPKI